MSRLVNLLARDPHPAQPPDLCERLGPVVHGLVDDADLQVSQVLLSPQICLHGGVGDGSSERV